MAEAAVETPRPSLSPWEPEPEWEVARLFPPRGQWTEEDFLALPDERRVELSDGCLEVLPMPTEAHQILLAFLLEALVGWVRPRRLGIVLPSGINVRLRSGKIRQPDVAYMGAANRARRKNEYWEGADLVAEIVSGDRKDRERDLRRKPREYARAGISEYWIIDPQEECVLVLALDGEAYREHGRFVRGEQVTSVVLAGFEVSVEELFASAEEAGEG